MRWLALSTLVVIACEREAGPPGAPPPAASTPAATLPALGKPSGACLPVPAGGARLSDDAAFRVEELPAVRAVRSELRRLLLAPEAFLASVTLTDELAIVELKDATGTCKDERNRTLTYDRRAGRVIGTKVWQ